MKPTTLITRSRLISYTTTDGLKMKGELSLSAKNLATIIHIHGSCGNFYENEFIPFMASKYTRAGMNFLSVNNRGHDCLAEAYRNGELEYVGGYHEEISDCIYDIQGVIDYALKLGTKIILQGHSLGCLKVLMFLSQSKKNYDFILLSPSDSYQLQADYISPETVEEQVIRIKREYAGNFDVMLPKKEFGIREKDLEYYIPTTPKNLISLFGSAKTRLLAYRSPQDYFIDSNALIYFGGADRLQTEELETVRIFFQKRVKNVSFVFCENGDHHFHDYEKHVVNEIASWALKIS